MAAQNPTFRADTRIVEVEVIAHFGVGSHAPDLRREDVRLFDNGKEQQIISLEKIISDGSGDKFQTSAGQQTSGTFIILIDSLNSQFADQIRSQTAISRLLQHLPERNDLFSIYALGDELRLLHPFSSNLKSLRAAVNGYGGEQLSLAVPEPNDRTLLAISPNKRLGEQLVMIDSNAELRLAVTIDAFKTIANAVKNIRGPKSLLWITAGFPPTLDGAEVARAVKEFAVSRVMVYPIDARGLVACIGTCPPTIALNIETMETVAEGTGGVAYHDGNDLAGMARAVIDDVREGYILTYTPNEYRADGRTHTLEIKSSRKDLKLKYRPLYSADR